MGEMLETMSNLFMFACGWYIGYQLAGQMLALFP